MTNNVDILTMPIEGPMLHVTLTLAEVTAQREPMLKKVLLVLTMFIVMFAKEPVCCIWQRARISQMGPR